MDVPFFVRVSVCDKMKIIETVPADSKQQI